MSGQTGFRRYRRSSAPKHRIDHEACKGKRLHGSQPVRIFDFSLVAAADKIERSWQGGGGGLMYAGFVVPYDTGWLLVYDP